MCSPCFGFKFSMKIIHAINLILSKVDSQRIDESTKSLGFIKRTVIIFISSTAFVPIKTYKCLNMNCNI